ncbi:MULTISPECIES: Hint domain-containing protein [unclassified Roseovarius]|uniref:Hint domain-containing protein n=1 Tax=unclassified Roseovarius TaxID=2614913 RepID=UPI00273EDAEE|nr:Hint domain-containing protein [Roseovarius sp. MMSF_3350]
MGFPVPDTGEVTEDEGVVGGFLTASGDIDFSGLLGDAGQWTPATINGAYGSRLVIDRNGNWTYRADNSNAAIQALDSGETLTEVFTVNSTRGSSTITITINGADEPPCFVKGTLIDTPLGPRPVEDLRAGDMVLTRDHGPQALTWTGHREIDLYAGPEMAAFRPVRICKDALAPGVPERDILVSPQHRLLIRDPSVALLTGAEEVLCPVRLLENGQGVRTETVPRVSYHHLLFDHHQVVQSSGCASESFFPGELGLNGFGDETRQEVLALFPELRSLPTSYGPTARPVLKRHEARLMRKAMPDVPELLNVLRGRGAGSLPLPVGWPGEPCLR